MMTDTEALALHMAEIVEEIDRIFQRSVRLADLADLRDSTVRMLHWAGRTSQAPAGWAEAEEHRRGNAP